MSENQKSILVDLLLGLAISVVLFFMNFNSGYALMHLLSDCTFVPAVVLLGMGGLRMCTNSGSLDMLGYGFSTLLHNIRNFGKINYETKEDYFSYTQRVAEERKPFAHYLISGVIFLAVSLGCLAAYTML